MRTSGVLGSLGSQGTLGTAAFVDTSAFEPAGAVAAEAADRETADALRYLRRARVAATTSSGATTLATILGNKHPTQSGFASTIGASGTGKLTLTAHSFESGDEVKVSGASNTLDDLGAALNGQNFVVTGSTANSQATGSSVWLSRTYGGAPIALTGTPDANITLTRVDANIGVWVLQTDWCTVNPSKILSATWGAAAGGTLTFLLDLPAGLIVGGKFWVAGVTPSGYNNATSAGWTVATVSADGLTVTVTGVGNPGGSYAATNTDTNTASIYLWSLLIADVQAAAAVAPAKKVVLAFPAGSASPWFAANVEVRANCVRSVFGAQNTGNGSAHYADIPRPWDPYFQSCHQQMLTNAKAVLTAVGVYASVFGARQGGMVRDTIEMRIPDQQSLVTLKNLSHMPYGVSWAQADNAGGHGLLRAGTTKQFVASDVGSVVWGSVTNQAANGIPAGATITAVAADGSTATLSAAVTSDFIVPATATLQLKRDVTGLGYTNSNCAKDWLYLAGAKNVVGTSQFGNYALVASGGCGTVVGTDGSGYTSAKVGSKPTSGTILASHTYAAMDVVTAASGNRYYCILGFTTGGSPTDPASDATHWAECAWDVFVSMLTATFNSTEKLIGAYLTKQGFPNIQRSTATGLWQVSSGGESKDPTTGLPDSGDPPQWAVLVDRACIAYGSRGIHMQQSLDEAISYAYWSNSVSPSVQTEFVPGSTPHITSQVGFQFQQSEFDVYPELDYPSGVSFSAAMSHAINNWAAVYIELFPPQPKAYATLTAAYAVAVLRAEATNTIDLSAGDATFALPSGVVDTTTVNVLVTAGDGRGTINDPHGNTVITVTKALYGVELAYDAPSDSWWVAGITTVPAAVVASPQAMARGAHLPQFT